MVPLVVFAYLALTESDYLGIKGLITAATPVALALIAFAQFMMNRRVKRNERRVADTHRTAEKAKDIAERDSRLIHTHESSTDEYVEELEDLA